MDAKDILGLPKNALPMQEKKSKPPKESQRKPDGISREVLRTPIFGFSSNIHDNSRLRLSKLIVWCRFTPLQEGWHLWCQPLMLITWSEKFNPKMRRFACIISFYAYVGFILLASCEWHLLRNCICRLLGNGFHFQILPGKITCSFIIGYVFGGI